MQITELLSDGLRRVYACTIPAAVLALPHEQRLDEIAKTLTAPGFAAGAVPLTVVKQRFGAAVLGEVLEDAVAQGTQALVKDLGLSPARPPKVLTTDFAEGGDLKFQIEVEVLPEIPMPDFAGIVLEHQHTEPTPEEVEGKLHELALRHGQLVEVPARPAALGETLVCDVVGRVPDNLLANGAGLGAVAGVPGSVPREWSAHLPDGLVQAVATGTERGLPWFSLAVSGRAPEGGAALLFPTWQRGVTAAPRQVMTFRIGVRLVDGALPEGAVARIGFNLRSRTDFLGALRVAAALDGRDRATFELPDDPAIAFARPVLDIELPVGARAGFTLRFGQAQVYVGREEPPGSVLAGGAAHDMAVEVGGRAVAPGFADQLVGMTPGESREVEVVFPADHKAIHVAGAHVRFRVTAKQLRRREPHAINDDLARKAGVGSLGELREAIRASLQGEHDRRARQLLRAALLEALSERVHFPVPQSMVDAEYAALWRRRRSDTAHAAGSQTLDDGEEDQELRTQAERRIRLGLLLMEIGRAHGLEVDAQEMEKAMRREAARFPGQEEQVLEFFRLNPEAVENLRSPLLEESAIDFVLGRVALTRPANHFQA